MVIQKLVLAGLVLGGVAAAAASPSYAQGVREISGARAAAVHDCSSLADRDPKNDWGKPEAYQYRACMAEHGQQE
jgi:hypothetical protein